MAAPVHVYLEENNTEEYTKAHERRLEALAKANIVSKNRNGAWDIPDDYLDRVRAYHKQLAKTLPTPLSRDSTLTISQMETARGATWLDDELSRRVHFFARAPILIIRKHHGIPPMPRDIERVCF